MADSLDPVLDGDQVQVVAKGGGPSPWLLAAAVVVVIAAFGLLGRSGPNTDSESGSSSTSGPSSGADRPTEQGALADAGPPGGSEVVVDATDLADQALGRHLASTAILVVSHPDVGLDLYPLDGSPSQALLLNEVPERGGLGVIEDRLIYVGDGTALAVSLDGEQEPLSLGPADRILSAGISDRIWLGTFHDEANQLVSYTWREVDLAESTFRTTIRQEPLEFPSPGLVWGFDSSVWRLIDDENRPWRLVTHGYPVAVGLNDAIIKVCNSDQTCRRAWFDADSGERQDPVLDDVAEMLPVDSSGQLSPDGRYVAKTTPGGGPTLIYSVTGRLVTDACLHTGALSWLTEVGLVACRTGQGVSIFDLETGAHNDLVIPNDSDDRTESSYEFVLVGGEFSGAAP